jgi:hypothetical protein
LIQSVLIRAIGHSSGRLRTHFLKWEVVKDRSSISHLLMQLQSFRKTPHGLLATHTGSSQVHLRLDIQEEEETLLAEEVVVDCHRTVLLQTGTLLAGAHIDGPAPEAAAAAVALLHQVVVEVVTEAEEEEDLLWVESHSVGIPFLLPSRATCRTGSWLGTSPE